MKVLMMLLFFVGSQMVFAQQREESSKKDFSDFPLEEPKPKRTKVLEIRYYQLSMDNHYPLDTIVVDNQKVRLFKTLQQATEYFFLVKDTVVERLVCYVICIEPKKNQYFPFEIKH